MARKRKRTMWERLRYPILASIIYAFIIAVIIGNYWTVLVEMGSSPVINMDYYTFIIVLVYCGLSIMITYMFKGNDSYYYEK